MATLTICGGGNAAHVLAALAAHAGWETHLFAPFGDEARRLRAGAADGGITARFAGRPAVTGRPRRISADPAVVVPGSTLVLLALPAFAHGSTLQAIVPYLEPEAAVGALPARGGFDYQAQALLAAQGHTGPIFGLQTLPWACRITAYGREVAVLGVKAVVAAAVAVQPAAAKAGAQAELWPVLRALLGVPLQPVSSFLALTLANTGQIIHPGTMYGLCHGREERTFSTGEIPLFYQGVDTFTAGVLQAMSDDVQTVAAALADQIPHFDAAEVPSLHHWLLTAYPHDIEDGSSLQRALVTNRAYCGLRLPVHSVAGPSGQGLYQANFSARYLAEDVPFGLVVVRGIAGLAGVATPALDRVIRWAEARTGRQYLAGGALAGPDVQRSRAPQAYGIHDLEWLAGGMARNQHTSQPAS